MTHLPLPPGPSKKFLGDRLLSLQRDPLAYIERLRNRYGDVVHLMIGSEHLVLLNHPDLIHDVLVTHNRNFHKGYTLQQSKRILGEGLLTSEGEYHLSQRRLMQPIFHRHAIANFATVMVECAARTAERWRADEPFNIAPQMEALTLAVAAKTLLGADIDADAQELGRAVHELMDLFNPVLLLMADILEKFPLPPTRRLNRSKATLDAAIYRIIDRHRAAGTGDDLLSMLLDAQDDAGNGRRMTDVQLRDEVLVILLAGFETIANALTWTWYLLSNHPDVEAQFHGELHRVLDGRLPTAADVDKLAYTRMLLSETLRLYPSVWFLDRRALDDYVVAGYRVPAGSTVLMSQWLVQRDPRFYSNPSCYDPLRWTPAEISKRPKYSYFPFGAGPRVCIGEHFAWMEGVLLLATIGQRWRVRALDSNVVPNPQINLLPRNGIRVRVEPRSRAP